MHVQAVLLHSPHNSSRYVTDSNTEKYLVKYAAAFSKWMADMNTKGKAKE